MSGLIDQLQSRTATPDERPRVLPMAEPDADDVLDALSSDTGRTTFRALFEEPATASELADRLDHSLQNVHYHISNLEDADLIEPVETVYSEKGKEMTVYGPASDPLVFVGDDEQIPAVQQSLGRIVGGLGLLAAASLFVQWGAERLVRTAGGAGPGAGAASPNVEVADPSTTPLVHLVFEVFEPGLLFFFGCLAVAGLLVIVVDR